MGRKASIIQAAFLVGWALGGGFFGWVADLIGRSRALVLTILTYACFTGFFYFSTEWWHLLAFRFLAALGIGGEWAVGASRRAVCAAAVGKALRRHGLTKLPAHRLPDPPHVQLALAAQVERALRQQAGRAFNVPPDNGVASAERTFPGRVVRAEERDAGGPGMRGEMRQRAVRRHNGRMHR